MYWQGESQAMNPEQNSDSHIFANDSTDDSTPDQESTVQELLLIPSTHNSMTLCLSFCRKNSLRPTTQWSTNKITFDSPVCRKICLRPMTQWSTNGSRSTHPFAARTACAPRPNGVRMRSCSTHPFAARSACAPWPSEVRMRSRSTHPFAASAACTPRLLSRWLELQICLKGYHRTHEWRNSRWQLSPLKLYARRRVFRELLRIPRWRPMALMLHARAMLLRELPTIAHASSVLQDVKLPLSTRHLATGAILRTALEVPLLPALSLMLYVYHRSIARH